MRNLEQELKLELDEREYRILCDLSSNQPIEQANYYFSTPQIDKSTMIRLRTKQGVFLVCYKKRLSYTNGVMVSEEKECEVSPEYAKKLINQGITAHELNNFFGGEFYDDVTCLGMFVTLRKKFTLLEWTLELDHNVYFDTADYEVECECADVQSLEKLKSYLNYNYGIVIRPSLTKYERFLAKLPTTKKLL